MTNDFPLSADRPAHSSHEDDRGEAHNHGGAPVRDAAADVVRIRLPVLDDVGRRRPRCHRQVSHNRYSTEIQNLQD